MTSGSEVDFLQDPLSGLSYSSVDCVRGGLARTLLSSIKKMYLSVHVYASESERDDRKLQGLMAIAVTRPRLVLSDTLTH